MSESSDRTRDVDIITRVREMKRRWWARVEKGITGRR